MRHTSPQAARSICVGGKGATPENQLPGNCSSVGLTTTGPTFGQDGVRVVGGAKVSIKDSSITQNLVNGTGYQWRVRAKDPFTFGHLFSQQLLVELRALDGGVAVAGS